MGMTTTATQEGEEWVLNGSKKFISQTGDAHVYTVFAKTDPESGSRGISAFVVEKGTPGFDDSHKLKLMMAHSIGEPHFDNCRLPYTSLIGERGQGIRIALGTLNTFRTTVGAAAVGMGQAAFEEALKYAKDRTAFGQHLSDFQAIQFKLADMAVSLDAARLLAYRAAWLRDTGTPTVIKESSFAKLFATEAASQIVNESLQIHGGAGLEKGRRIERLYREIRGVYHLRGRLRDPAANHCTAAFKRGVVPPQLGRRPTNVRSSLNAPFRVDGVDAVAHSLEHHQPGIGDLFMHELLLRKGRSGSKLPYQ